MNNRLFYKSLKIIGVFLIISSISTATACDQIYPEYNHVWGLKATADNDVYMIRLLPGAGISSQQQSQYVVLNIVDKQLEPLDDVVEEVQELPLALDLQYDFYVNYSNARWGLLPYNFSMTSDFLEFNLTDSGNYNFVDQDYFGFVSEALGIAYLIMRSNNPVTYDAFNVVYFANMSSGRVSYVEMDDVYFYGQIDNLQFSIFDDELIMELHGGSSCDDIYYFKYDVNRIDFLASTFSFDSLLFDARANQIITAGSFERNDEVTHAISVIKYDTMNFDYWNISQSEIDTFFETSTITTSSTSSTTKIENVTNLLPINFLMSIGGIFVALVIFTKKRSN